MKFKKIAVALCAAALSLTAMSVTAFAADTGVKIDATNFPDANFREYVKKFDTDWNNSFSAEEIAAVKEIDVSLYFGANDKDKIQSLAGIEKFTELTTLKCDYNKLTELNVENNTALTDLNCDNNELTELNISKNSALTKLICSHNHLTELDVSKNTVLTTLYCNFNQFKTLDVSKNTALNILVCPNNGLTKINVNGCAELTWLFCENNELTEIDVSKNPELIYLGCCDNHLKTLDVSKNTKLKGLRCYNNKLTGLNISASPNIVKAYTKGDDVSSSLGEDAFGKSYSYKKTTGGTTMYYLYWDKATKIYTQSTSHTPHTWDSGKVTKAATYGAEGVKTYTCTVCGATKTASIAKKTVNKAAAKSAFTCTSNAVRINWNSLSGVSGYRICRYDPAKKTWVGIANIYDPNVTNYRVSGLNAGTTYKFKVKAFVKENGKTYFGTASSTITTSTKPKTTAITKANKVATAVRLYWKKLTCTGYRIDRYDSAQKKWVKVKAISTSATTQYRISGLKKNTTYKFRIVPFVKLGNKFIYGAASKTFAVKTTK